MRSKTSPAPPSQKEANNMRTYREYIGQSKTPGRVFLANAHCQHDHAGENNIELLNGRYVCCGCQRPFDPKIKTDSAPALLAGGFRLNWNETENRN